MIRVLSFLLTLLAGGWAFSQTGNDSTSAPKPLLVWTFDEEKEAGPRPPSHPHFAPKNTAGHFTGVGKTIRESDHAEKDLRFGLGDSLTIEAWVRLDRTSGAYSYILGKGRNGKTAFSKMNQNYALRLCRLSNGTGISFLFSSEPTPSRPAEFHRWTSERGLTSGGWHHVAVSYTFGKKESLRGYIDGEPVKGSWDLGGATDRAPVQDADDLTLGSGNGGGAGNSFFGRLDNVMLWRTALPAETIADRYEFVPPPPALTKEMLTPGRVTVQICEEGMPTRNAWPDTSLLATETYFEDAFGFFEVPQKYIDTGIRADRSNPFLLRTAAMVNFPAGKHRVLLRGRGASRLYVNDKLLLSTPFPTSDSGGHGTVRDPKSYLNLGPDFRFAPPGNAEAWITFESSGGPQMVLLETIVGNYIGSSKRRPELGETVFAISPSGSESWQLVTPTSRVIPYTDAGWAVYEAERSARLDAMNTAAREACRTRHAAEWNARREAAKAWLASTDEVPVPPLAKGFPANNLIDHFLAQRIAHVRTQIAEANQGTIDFYQHIQPLLEAKCFGCHTGAKAKGGLRFDGRADVLKGGKGDGPGVIPGKPSESSILYRVQSTDPTDMMPPKGDRLTAEETKRLETWIREGAKWPEFAPQSTELTPLTDDLTFLRRVTLDTVGVVPTLAEIAAFQADSSPNKRSKVIDRLLADPRSADHAMGYWLDVLAENPNILNPTLNNTGPFRWWLHESLLDNKPMDLFVTELLRMRGSERFGGPAGFATASQNDVPMATKGVIVASAFLGVQMKCARCHDAPSHRSKQEDLFQLAAMMATKPISVPLSSSVPLDKIHTGGRKPLIEVTLKPGTAVSPAWPFADFLKEATLDGLPHESRDRLAALITLPQNERFAQVIVNRIWARLMGRGIVEPVDDWEKAKPTHPELLRRLAREFVRSGYDRKQIQRLILNSHAYQRQTNPNLNRPGELYVAPAPRRLAAEQIVDSLFTATGKPFHLEEVSLDIDGKRALQSSITLGRPSRSWMLTSTSNERDRPSLALPRIQAVTDVLTAFGWRGARQDPTSRREDDPTILQPAILSNGTMSVWLTRLSDDHGVTRLALRKQSLDQFLDSLFLKMFTRLPTASERAALTAQLERGFTSRFRTPPAPTPVHERLPEPYVSWSNHLAPEATIIRRHQEEAARRGDPPTQRLDPDWRNRLEDLLWAMVNSSECVFAP